MKEQLVDVKIGERVVHTFPVAISDPLAESNQEAFKEKALEAAAHAKAVANDDLRGLRAQMHVSRGGRLEPDPDPLGVLAETKEGLDQFVRDRAYAVWEREGCPAGRADEHGYRVRDFEKA